MSDLLESLGIHSYQAPQPLKVADGFEPMKLLAVNGRLRAWSDITIDSGPLMQVREDVTYLLASHLDYFKRYEKAERACWYREDNESTPVSWQERAEEMARKLEAAKSVLWMAERYSQSTDAKNGFGGSSTPDHDFQAAMEIIEP